MREFNIFGPVDPAKHYHVDRVAVKADLRARIERGRYLTLNASRQTGKTTLFHEIITELEATGNYFAILLDFEQLADFKGRRFYERLGVLLERWQQQTVTHVQPINLRDHGDLIDWLQSTVRAYGKKGILIIDESDAVDAKIIKPILSLLRGMYLEKNQNRNDILHSVVLVGVRNLPSLLEGSQSPFNIADQFTVPYFTAGEVADLLCQHTADTGQRFEPAVIQGIAEETEGQPFLVNRLGQILTQEVVPEATQPITQTNLNYALARLITENNSHFYSIVAKASSHRHLLMPLLLYNQTRTDFLDPATQELIMYGVLRVLEDQQQLRYARIGNPIYRKMLLLRFIVETKIWYDKTKYEEGKRQLARYLQAASLHKGYLVIFDEHLEKNPLLAEQGELCELQVDSKTLRIYLVGVTV